MAINNPTEPSADTRSSAKMWHEMFIALKDEGFTESQALTIIGQHITGAMIANSMGDEDNK